MAFIVVICFVMSLLLDVNSGQVLQSTTSSPTTLSTTASSSVSINDRILDINFFKAKQERVRDMMKWKAQKKDKIIEKINLIQEQLDINANETEAYTKCFEPITNIQESSNLEEHEELNIEIEFVNEKVKLLGKERITLLEELEFNKLLIKQIDQELELSKIFWKSLTDELPHILGKD